ncbi:hypothetical protein ERJ75_000060000 [Trypanosoma vivax]|nr:hypothetical protein ERJ75_000060000 [Trypanosoma vivax]
MGNSGGDIQPLSEADAAKVRAGHFMPSFSVALDGAYRFLRLIVSERPINAIRVTALPRALGFSVELSAGAPSSQGETHRTTVDESAALANGGRSDADGHLLAHLTQISEDVRLRVWLAHSGSEGEGCRPPHQARSEELFYGAWQHSDPLPENACKGRVLTAIKRKLEGVGAAEGRNGTPRAAISLNCSVRGLFCCLPVRRLGAIGSERRSDYRLRAECHGVFSAVYRMGLECLVAPTFFNAIGALADGASLFLRLGRREAPTMDEDVVIYVAIPKPVAGTPCTKRPLKREPPNTREGGESRGQLASQRLHEAFMPYISFQWGQSWSGNQPDAPCLRETVVEKNRFTILYVCAQKRPPGLSGQGFRQGNAAAKGLALSNVTPESCHIVDELHPVYFHMAVFSAGQYPLLFIAPELLANESELRRLFHNAWRSGAAGPGAALPDESEIPINFWPELPRAEAWRGSAASTALRVSALTERLSCAKGGPRRTPFCPLGWARSPCKAVKLSQLRLAASVALDPARTIARAYGAPTAWPGRKPYSQDHQPCPFRVEDFAAQWDSKFLIFHLHGESSHFGSCRCNQGSERTPSQVSGALGAIPETLYVSDQHALHERIRLEQFMATAESYVRHRPNRAYLPEKVPADIRRDVCIYRRFLERWGWGFGAAGECKFDGDKAAVADPSAPNCRWECDFVRQWPTIEAEGHAVTFNRMEILRKTLEEFAVTIPPPHATGGGEEENACECVVPSCVFEFFVTRSCRGAIMFGHRLSTANATRIVKALGATRQYHLCSHGRPSFAALQRRSK